MKERAILNDIPFEKFYQSSRKEASRKKPVFFIHKYFARRITSNYRLMLLASFYDKEEDLYKKFYEASSKFENIRILDPFMGGGTTILEAGRFNTEIIGNDLQPLSLFVSEALVKQMDEKELRKDLKNIEDNVGEKIKDYYKTKCTECCSDAEIMYAFHVKTFKKNEEERIHKLFSNFVLSLRKDTFTLVCPKCGEIVKTTFKDGQNSCSCGYLFESPRDSLVSRGIYTDPQTGDTQNLLDLERDSGYPHNTEIVALEYYCYSCKARHFKKPDIDDLNLYKKAQKDYKKIKDTLPIPTQKIPKGYNTNQMINHGYNHFSDMFNNRQLLTLGLLMKTINELENKESQFWCQLAFSDMLEMNNMFCRYQASANKIGNIFFNHAYVPITMPVENNVWGTKLGTGTFIKTIEKIIRGKKFNTDMYDIDAEKGKDDKYKSIKKFNEDKVEMKIINTVDELSEGCLLRSGDSRNLDFIPDKSVDLVLTDPPYGANIMYSELIDFFHVWNYRSSLAKELGFTSELSPKTDEIIMNKRDKDYDYYEDGITSVFKETFNKLKEDGLLVFSFHDKSLESWLSILNGIYESGFILTKAYPMQSESRTGAHTSNKNSISIDIMLVCKKKESSKDKKLDLNNRLIENINQSVREKLRRLERVGAELTLPDIENIAIAELFTEIQEYNIYDQGFDSSLINFMKKYINKLEENFEEIEITKIRSGWWSELYKKKWDV